MILDLFAGPGGWDEGMRSIGIEDVVGLEWDRSACQTRAAAGHRTIRCDVAEYPTEPFVGRVRGLIASPPCQAWSMAGKGAGRGEVGRVHAAVELCRDGWNDDPLSWGWADERTPLILQPLRWAWALRPGWVACEQVPPALGVWKHMADVLRSWGYAADARVLCAADYGEVIDCPLHEEDGWLANALCAGTYSVPRTAREYAGAPATTGSAGEPINDVWTAAAHWGRAIGQGSVAPATCGELAVRLAAHAEREGAATPHGGEDDEWTNAATSVFGERGCIAASIALSLRSSWDALYAEKKLSITSMEIPPTTIHRILRSIAATAAIRRCTTTASRSVGCGLCVDRGVPQTRDRAYLLAHREAVRWPEPTHARTPEGPSLFGAARKPWVTMAEALGWDGTLTGNNSIAGGPLAERSAPDPAMTVGGRADLWRLRGNQKPPQMNGEYHAVPANRPAQAITGNAGLYRWVKLRNGAQDNATERSADQPAPTLASSMDNGDTKWVHERPATAVCADPRIGRPGHKDRDKGEAQFQEGSVRVEAHEAAVLQGFPADYPWQGTKTARFRQIGDAVCPPVAAALVGALDLHPPTRRHDAT